VLLMNVGNLDVRCLIRLLHRHSGFKCQKCWSALLSLKLPLVELFCFFP
jgi:hypothetical protein